MSKRLNLTLTDEQYKELKRVAEEKHQTLQATIRWFLRIGIKIDTEEMTLYDADNRPVTLL